MARIVITTFCIFQQALRDFFNFKIYQKQNAYHLNIVQTFSVFTGSFSIFNVKY